MPRSRRPGRSRVTLALLILASLTIITLDFRDSGPVRAVRSGAGTVLSPLDGVGETVSSPFRNAWHGMTDYEDVQAENERLRRELDKTEGDRLRNQILAEQNEELKEAADIKFAGAVPMVGAEVTSRARSNFDQTVEVNIGSGEGVKEGMAVVTNAGLVGKVSDVFGGRSVVQLVTDPEFRFGVRLQTTGDVVVARGDGAGRPLVVDGGIKADAPVPVDDLVYTSGQDRSPFPPRVPVGTVESTQESQDHQEQSVRIDPVADLDSLNYVNVMLYDAPS